MNLHKAHFKNVITELIVTGFRKCFQKVLQNDDCMVPCVLWVLFFPPVTAKPRLEYCKQAGRRKVILCSLLSHKAWLLSYSQEKPLRLRSLGSNYCWWYISHTEVSGVIVLITLWFLSNVHTHFLIIFKKKTAMTLNWLNVFALWFNGDLQPLFRDLKTWWFN